MWIWNAMHFLAMGIAFPYFPVFLERGGLTPSQIGLAFTISSVVSGFFSYYMGRLSDRAGRLKILISTTLLASLSYLLLSLGFDPITSVAIFTLLMMGGGAANTIFTAYSIDVLERAGIPRGIGFARIRNGGNIGWIIGTLSGGALVSVFGLNPVFAVSALIVGAAALACVGLKEERRERREVGAEIRTLSLLKGVPGVFLLTMSLVMIVNASIMNFLSLHLLNTHGASPFEISAAFALMAISDIPAMIYFGRLSDRIGRGPVLLLCLAVWPLRLALIGLSLDRTIVILAQSLSSLTFGGFFVVSIAYASEIVPEHMRGAYMGLYGATFSVGGIVGGYLWGSVIEATSYAEMFLYVAAFSTIPIALAGLTLRRREN